MLGLQLWRLRKLCDKHGIDYQMIDHKLTYRENMILLSAYVPKHVEDLVKEGKSMDEWYVNYSVTKVRSLQVNHNV